MRKLGAKSIMAIVGLLLLAVAAGCASIGNPSGGPRDETPPRFVRANPAPGSAGVSNKISKIRIDFDEIVNVKDAFSTVVVSPPSAQIPRVASQGRTVNVEFRDTLMPNTTYTIDFGNAIEDNNEGNPLENFSYTFSTGPEIDSLRISGMVLNALTLEPLQQKLIGVYKLDESLTLPDSAIFKTRFDRVAKTDERGRFSVEGLSEGAYRIFMLDDTDNNFIYSSPDEEMGYSTEVIRPYSEPGETIDSIFNLKKGVLDTVVTRTRTMYYPNNILLRSFLSSRRKNYIAKYERHDSTQIYINFGEKSKRAPEFSIVGAPDMKDWYIKESSRGNDTVTLWLKSRSLIATDTLRLRVEYESLDSLNRYTTTVDTLRFVTDRAAIKKAQEALAKKKKSDEKKNAKAKEKQDKEGVKEAQSDSIAPEIKLLNITFPVAANHDVFTPVIIDIEQPAARIDESGIRMEMKVDTLWKPVTDRPALRQDTLNPRRYYIDYPWKYGGQYRVSVDSLAVTGIYGLWNGNLQNEFKVKEEKEYCSLTLRLTDWPAGLPAFVELLSSGDAPERREPVKNGVVTFRNLNPGKYYVRVINDLNGNGEWDTGDYVEHRQAEESYYYPKAINIKQNWNKDEKWEVFATAVDEMKPEAIKKNKPKERAGRQTTKRKQQEEEEVDE